MEYTREYWKPRIATNPNRFRKLNESNDYVELINEPESITQAGTATTAARLNNMEAGIEGAVAGLNEIQSVLDFTGEETTFAGNADTATLATQALAIKPLGNNIALPTGPTSVTKIIKIATVNYIYSGTINIRCTGVGIEDIINVYINGEVGSNSGLRVIYSKNILTEGIKNIIVTNVTEAWNSARNIYAEIVTVPNNISTTTLEVVETASGTFTPSMTEVSSVEGTVVDSLSLDYLRGDISSYQHVFTKNIIGNLTGNADTASKASKANVRVSLRHGNTWFNKTWTGLTDFGGVAIWTDGDNIYYSDGKSQFVLNKTTSTWTVKTWTGLTSFIGSSVWSDGENIYSSDGTSQYVLNKATSTWTVKTWTGLTSFNGSSVWSDGENIYSSWGTSQYVLNKATSTWTVKTWTGLTSFNGRSVWSDGENIYSSWGTSQYVLNKTTSTWTAKTWTGLTSFYGAGVWTDGENIYFSDTESQYVLNKATSTWTVKTWTGGTYIRGEAVWTDGENIYYNFTGSKFVLPATRHNYIDDDKYNSLFGIVTNCNCSTLSNRFVFSNE